MLIGRFLESMYKRRFESLFAALILFIFVPNFFSYTFRTEFVDPVVRSFLLISTYALVWKEARLRRRLVLTTILILLIATWLVNQRPVPVLQYMYLSLLILFFCHIALEVILQIYSQKEVDFQTIMSVLCGYLLLGVLGFFAFSIIHIHNAEAFNIERKAFDDLIYYTFITLTTIGYGDIAPHTLPAKSAAVILGIAGQFYTTVIIALIIGKFLQGKSHNT